MRFRSTRARVVMMVAAFAAGCDTGGALELRRWSLSTGETLVLPGEVGAPEESTYVLETEVELPAPWHGRELWFVVPRVEALASVEFDGRPTPVERAFGPAVYRSALPLLARVSPDLTADGRVRVRWRVQHRWLLSERLGVVPELGPSVSGLASVSHFFSVPLALASSVAQLQLALTCLAIFLFDRRRASYAYFGLQTLFLSYFPFFVSGYSQALFGRYDVPPVAAGLFLAIACSVEFTCSVLDRPRPSRVVWLAAAVGVGLSVVGIDRYDGVRVLAWPVTFAVVAVCVWQCAVFASYRGPRRSDALLLSAAWLVLLLGGGVDCAAWLGFGEWLGGVRPGALAQLVYAITLSVILSLRHLRAMTERETARDALTARVRDVEQLANELRRSLARRSDELLHTLASLRGVEPVDEGDVLGGRYRIGAVLGEGAMGRVYAAERLDDGRSVAVKVTLEREPLALARLLREARAAIAVQHPNLVRVLDVEVDPSGGLFVVMERVRGRALARSRERYGDARFARTTLLDVACGLEALHAAGLVHRDLKPANVLLEEETGRAKIADFGLTRSFADEALTMPGSRPFDDLVLMPKDPTLTATGAVPGTPSYMAPELLRGVEPSPTADVFAFGVIAFELLHERRPFARPLWELDEPRPPASGWAEALGPSVASTVERCLSFDAAERPSASALRAVLASRTLTSS